MSKNQFTGTATQPQRNRKLCQFNKNQYCKINYDFTYFRLYIFGLLNSAYSVDLIFFLKALNDGAGIPFEAVYSNSQ